MREHSEVQPTHSAFRVGYRPYGRRIPRVKSRRAFVAGQELLAVLFTNSLQDEIGQPIVPIAAERRVARDPRITRSNSIPLLECIYPSDFRPELPMIYTWLMANEALERARSGDPQKIAEACVQGLRRAFLGDDELWGESHRVFRGGARRLPATRVAENVALYVREQELPRRLDIEGYMRFLGLVGNEALRATTGSNRMPLIGLLPGISPITIGQYPGLPLPER
ncbi:MAG TPA: hypothetical protein VJ836_02650 [Candidatus Saccharimonadales bacterium]|nr:hypothetical protein [Candidatus Saccharimonadales bacterium]